MYEINQTVKYEDNKNGNATDVLFQVDFILFIAQLYVFVKNII